MNQSVTSVKFGVLSVLAMCGLGVLSSFLIQQESDVVLPESTKMSGFSARDQGATPDESRPQALPGVQKTSDGFEFDEDIKLKLQRISSAYESQAQYPSFSVPINPDELASKYLPDNPVANDLPAKLTDPNSPTLSIKTNQSRYYYGDALTAQVEIQGLSSDEHSAVSARLVSDQQILAHATVFPVEGSEHSYVLDFSELRLTDVDWKQELTVDVEFQFLGETYQRGSSIEYLTTIASVDQVASAEVYEDFLTIPVYISTEKSGYHRVRANLYDAKSGTPLVHLRAEGSIEGSGALTLKAHIAALKHAGSEGPYELRDISLQRLPSKPDYITEFGRVEQTSFQVEGYSFSEYLDRPYHNEKAQRIAKELRRLGS
jgi:hypothetical protein